jgi:hypothetical protein
MKNIFSLPSPVDISERAFVQIDFVPPNNAMCSRWVAGQVRWYFKVFTNSLRSILCIGGLSSGLYPYFRHACREAKKNDCMNDRLNLS